MLVYQYGILPPTQNAARVDEQMLLAHRYRNTLIAIERARRAVLREAMRDADVERGEAMLARAQADVDRLTEEVNAARKQKRSRAETEAQRVALRTARAYRWELVRCVRDARIAARKSEAVDAICDAINERASELRRGARALCGVFWGTYLLIEAADRASRSAPLYKDGLPNDPHFVRWSGDGHVGIQYPHGLAADAVFGEADTTMRIDPIDPAVWYGRGVAFTTVHVRVGSHGPGRPKPVWASFPIKMHRPFPPGAVIRRAEIARVVEGPRVSAEIGRRARWVINITLDAPRRERTNDPPKADAVAINVGWRVVPEGLRVLTWQGTDGAEGKLVLPPSLLGRMQSVQDLAGTRQNAFNAARAAIVAYLDSDAALPDWFRAETATIALWKSGERLTSLAFLWQTQRFPGDEAAYAALSAWRHHDCHLGQYELGRRGRTHRHRRELVRCLAAELARRYATVVHDDTDLRDFQDLPAPAAPGDVGQNETARLNRVRSSASATRLILQGTFAREGGSATKLSARAATIECHVCAHTEAFDAAAELCHTCAQCGTTWDQDENHVRVLLRRWRERPSVVESPDVARTGESTNDPEAKRETSLQRGKRIRSEKMAKREAAREASSNSA